MTVVANRSIAKSLIPMLLKILTDKPSTFQNAIITNRIKLIESKAIFLLVLKCEGLISYNINIKNALGIQIEKE